MGAACEFDVVPGEFAIRQTPKWMEPSQKRRKLREISCGLRDARLAGQQNAGKA